MFSIGTLQASMNCCVDMEMQDTQKETSTSMSDEQESCHSMGDEVAAEEETENSCCESMCDSCVSASVTFNSQANKFEQIYTERYMQNEWLAHASNHIKIPTPPPNS